MDSDRWRATPETDPRTCFETWIPRFARGEHHYRIVLRGKSYDAEKNGKLIGQFIGAGAALHRGERAKGGGVASEEDGAGHGEDARSAS